MDAFESNLFYDIDKGQPRPVALDDYAYANLLGTKATTYYANYGVQFPPGDTVATMQNAIAKLKAELNTWTNKKCPKTSVAKVLIPFVGIGMNIQAQSCQDDRSHRMQALGQLISEYSSQLQLLQQQQAAADKAAQDAFNSANETYTPGMATGGANAGLMSIPAPTSGSSTMTWVLVGVGVLVLGGVVIWAVSGSKKAAPAPQT